MRDPRRIDEVLNIIKIYWEQHPDLRLCQLLSNIAVSNGWVEGNDLFYLEDDQLIFFIGQSLMGETKNEYKK